MKTLPNQSTFENQNYAPAIVLPKFTPEIYKLTKAERKAIKQAQSKNPYSKHSPNKHTVKLKPCNA